PPRALHSFPTRRSSDLLSWALTAAGGASRAFGLTNRELWLSRVTATFHGRDIFMPVAAHLAAGADLDAAGAEIDLAGLVMLPARSEEHTSELQSRSDLV